MSVAIVAVLYEEPEYAETQACIEACDIPTVWVDRKGVGSLAKAYNEGFRRAHADFVWFMSNVTFGVDLLPRLMATMEADPFFAAVQPAYESDHQHLRPNGTDWVTECPFVEFTCPLVRSEVFRGYPLHEGMPYWGHDLDWGYRVREAGWKLGCVRGVTVGHTYIRNSPPHPVTLKRKAMRRATNGATERELVKIYGTEWKSVLQWT